MRNATKNEGDAVVIDFGLLVSDLGSQNSNSTFSFSIVDGDCTNETPVYVQCPFHLPCLLLSCHVLQSLQE